ncbi:MAG: hypothetical protein LGB54_05810, partial [Sulfurovum sp.]|nr:hypothetical protein [Sulfurovum sp.]
MPFILPFFLSFFFHTSSCQAITVLNIKVSFSLSGNSVAPGEVTVCNCRAAAKACCINSPMTELLSPTDVYAM